MTQEVHIVSEIVPEFCIRFNDRMTCRSLITQSNDCENRHGGDYEDDFDDNNYHADYKQSQYVV